MKGLFITALAFFVLPGCTNEQVYDSIQGARRANECPNMQTPIEHDQCIEETNKRYSQYERERQETNGQ